jgi:membrane-associated phospholipid phosphatase
MATNQLWHDANQNGSYIAGTNDVAAMPSLHTALTMAIALMAWRINRLLGLVGFAYVIAMGFSLMYLGEHYFVDVAAGAVTASVAMLIGSRLSVRKARLVPFAIPTRASPASKAA